MQGFDFSTVGALLVVAMLVAMVSRRFDLPYSTGLVAAGIIVAPDAPDAPSRLTPDLIYLVFLPPLVFEAAIQIPWRPFRRDLPLLLALVTDDVVLAAAVTVGMLVDRLELVGRSHVRCADRGDHPGVGDRGVPPAQPGWLSAIRALSVRFPMTGVRACCAIGTMSPFSSTRSSSC